jgi:hypothetical protein
MGWAGKRGREKKYAGKIILTLPIFLEEIGQNLPK